MNGCSHGYTTACACYRVRPHPAVHALCMPAQIGLLSARTRVIRIRNVLTDQEDQIEVPCEEKLVEIRWGRALVRVLGSRTAAPCI